MMKQILKALFKYCKINKLFVNVKKTNLLVFSKGGRSHRGSKFYFGNEEIEKVKEYVYLGIPFVRSALFECASNNMFKKGMIAVDSTLRLIKNTKISSWGKVDLLFDSLIASTVLYSSPFWCVNYLPILEKLQCTFFKKILNLPSCTPGYAVRLEVNRCHISLKIFKLILNWINSIILMPNNRYPKIVFLKLTELSKRPDCILKYNWISLIKKHFFEPIGELEIWNNIGTFTISESRNNLLSEFSYYLKSLDFDSRIHSSSLLLYPNIEYSINNNWISLENKAFITQLKLMNVYNNRLIINNKIYILDKKCICEYCNLNETKI